MSHIVMHSVLKTQEDAVCSCTVAEIDDAIICRAYLRAVDPRAEREAEPPAHDSGARRGPQVGGRRPGEAVCAVYGARRRGRRGRRRRGRRIAPALQRTSREVRARVGASERQPPDGAADLDRGRPHPSLSRVVAELAFGVPAPALERTGGEVRARVGASERQPPDGAADIDRGRRVAMDRYRSHAWHAIAELPVVVLAPALQRTGGEVRARVTSSECQEPDGASNIDRGRRVAIFICAVAELAVGVPAPALQGTGREVHTRVLASEGQEKDATADTDRGRPRGKIRCA
jgi:hypothetical protein